MNKDAARRRNRRLLTGYRFTEYTGVVLDACGLLVPREEATWEVIGEEPCGTNPHGVRWSAHRDWVLKV